MPEPLPERLQSVADRPLVFARPGWIDRFDPRVRLVAAGLFVAMVVVCQRFSTLGLALGVAMVALGFSSLTPAAALRRLVPINLVVLMLILVLPWTMGHTPVVSLGPLRYSREGIVLAGLIALKGNAILAILVALVGTLDLTTLGHALSHLYVPRKLIHLLLFTVRYIDVLHREYERMRAAMRVRSFRPGMNWHTYRTYGHLVGMLLVRSLDRSERALAAMKCRGFRGRFYLLDHFALSCWDGWFAAAGVAVAVALAAVEWL